MRIACLQFAPQVGDVDNNLNRADSVLNRANPEDLDLLVLPELAFSGYNFKSLNEIAPFLEPTGAGITSLWARTIALKYDCVVAAGYPEKVDVSGKWPTSPEYYNSLLVVNEDGETTANYRKTHLYYTDERWALEGPDGFFDGHIDGLGNTAMGICMDLNPYRFEAPWSAYEFAFHILESHANIVIMSMAWLTQEDAREFSRMPNEPDMETVTYWIRRLEPLIRAETEEEIIVILANRTGVEDEAVYAGTSTVLGIKEGEVSVYGILGRGEKELLVVDTDAEPYAKLVYRPETANAQRTGQEEEHSTVGAGERITRPSSATSSTLSVLDGSVGDNNFSTNTSVASTTNGHIIYGGTVRVTHESLSPLKTNFAPTPIEPTPIDPTPIEFTPIDPTPSSPRYFRLPLDNFRTPDIPQSPIHTSLSRNLPSISSITSPHPSTRHSEELALLRNHRATPSVSKENNKDPARPSSPKSRNCSRTGRGERSDSVLANRPPSAMSNNQTSTRGRGETGPQRPEAPKSRNASRNQGKQQVASNNAGREGGQRSPPQPQKQEPQSQQLVQHRGESPDLVKIGADMMVFEEGQRPRRDSLECHADEDDFIVVHSSKREQMKPRDAERGHQPAKRENRRPSSASASNQPTRKPAAHSNSQGAKSNTTANSPEQPKKSRSASLHDRPKESPELPDASRNVSRGRARHTPYSPRQDSPTFTPPTLHKTGSRSEAVRTADKHALSASPSTREEQPKPKSRKAGDHLNRAKEHDRPSSSKSMDAADTNKVMRSPRQKDVNRNQMSVVVMDANDLALEQHDAPRTPRAMILFQDGPEPIKVPETTTYKCADRDPDMQCSDRPKTVLW